MYGLDYPTVLQMAELHGLPLDLIIELLPTFEEALMVFYNRKDD